MYIQYLDRFFNDNLTFYTMLERIKNMVDNTQLQVGNIIKKSLHCSTVSYRMTPTTMLSSKCTIVVLIFVFQLLL